MQPLPATGDVATNDECAPLELCSHVHESANVGQILVVGYDQPTVVRSHFLPIVLAVPAAVLYPEKVDKKIAH